MKVKPLGATEFQEIRIDDIPIDEVGNM
jgi:hypothetical protein